MSAEDIIADIIDTAQDLALDKAEEASSLARDAQMAALTVTDLGQIPVPVEPDS